MTRQDNDVISIIIPIYNVEPFLHECIDSVINQTYKNLEIILVDDGSTDLSGQICDDYAKQDKRVKVIHKKNEGVSAARNTGIRAAHGKYLCFVDGDDYVAEDYVTYLYNLAIKHECEITCTTKVMTPYNQKTKQAEECEIIDAETATERMLCYRLPIGVYSKLFYASFLKKNNLYFDESLVIGEGFNFNTDAFQRATKICIGQKMIYFYRKNNQTSVTTVYDDKKWRNGIQAIEKIRDKLIIKTKRVLQAWDYAYWRTKSDAYDLIMIHQAKKQFPDTYRAVTEGIRHGYILATRCPVSPKDRRRAFVMMIFPSLVPKCMTIRKKIFQQDKEQK